MPLVPLKEVYADANKQYYAVGQFNVNNLEFLQAVLETAEEMKSPAIVAASTSAIKYAGLNYLMAMVKTGAGNVSVPIALHLDHGTTQEHVVMCVDAGFTSVMIDGSHGTLEENIKITRGAADYAHKYGVTVEGELGRLGGIEDDVNVDEHEAFLTDPEEAEQFVRESKCDALAVAVGTSHGAYKFKSEAKLDFERIAVIKKRLGIPLVLHGASSVSKELLDMLTTYGGKMPGAKGVPDDAYKKAVERGINKINIDTDLRMAFVGAMRKVLTEQPKVFDPRKILGPGREAVKNVIRHKMVLFRSAGKG